MAGDAWGEPDAPLVLLLHGVGQTRHAWSCTGDILGEAGLRAIAFDARGHGDSDWAHDGDYSRDAMIRDLVALVAGFGGRRPALAGASMGGGVCLLAAGENRVDANALVLVDVEPRTEPLGVGSIRTFMDHDARGFESLEELADVLNSYRPRHDRPRNLDSLASSVRLDAEGRYHFHWDPRLVARTPEPVQRRLDSARHLALPTLLVRGGHADVMSEEGVFFIVRPGRLSPPTDQSHPWKHTLPQPVANADSLPYWNAARERRLVIRKCKACSQLHFMPRHLCPNCWSDQLEWVEAKGTGSVHSFTIVRRASDPAFARWFPMWWRSSTSTKGRA
jgi:pimeloyl-ACP methyl ester carboxylesterase